MSACNKPVPKGSITVLSSGEGTFDIYKVGKEDPFQLISEYVGEYNKEVQLTPGFYLILADCSSEMVVVLPSSKKTLVSHRVLFTTPNNPENDDKFSILCSRHAKSKSNQKLVNKFELNILSGVREMLVGMIPLKLDLTDTSKGSLQKEFLLSSFKVEDENNTLAENSFFVSPLGGLISITEYQSFGKNIYLLPGKYKVQVNGSSMNIVLNAGEVREVVPAFLKITSPKGVVPSEVTKGGGEPLFVEMNESHRLNYDEVYPILPSEFTLRLSDSKVQKVFDVASKENLVVPTNGIKVNFGCKEYEWECFGKKSVFVYQKDADFPFIAGKTDYPILFLDEEVYVEIEGARNIKKKVISSGSLESLDVGYLHIHPKPSLKKGTYTDLLRVEASDDKLSGYSIDLSLVQPTRLPLLLGSYEISNYISYVDDDVGDRTDTKIRVNITKGLERDIFMRIYLKESKYKKYLKKQNQLDRRRTRQVYSKLPLNGPIIE